MYCMSVHDVSLDAQATTIGKYIQGERIKNSNKKKGGPKED